MTGASEILVLILLITCVLILPRLFRSQPAREKPAVSVQKKLNRLSLVMRAALFFTFAYPIGAFVIMKLWQTTMDLYLLIGVFPVAAAWGGAWVIKGRNAK